MQTRFVTEDVGRQFADTYTVIDTIWNQPVGFIMIPILLSKDGKKFKEHPELMFVDGVRDRTIYEIEGCPAIKVRQKTISHIRGSGTNVDWVYNALKAFFTEDFIKTQFTLPNIWLITHNLHARKKAATEMAERNRMRKQMTSSDITLAKETAIRMRNRSAASHMREIRDLQR